jgi:multicomponent Na+:H+ antiporter subunit F
VTTVVWLTVGIIGAGALVAVIALLRVRLAVEKMVALDVLTTLMTGALVVLSLLFENRFILDIAIVYAVLSFGAVMVVARYREGGL